MTKENRKGFDFSLEKAWLCQIFCAQQKKRGQKTGPSKQFSFL